MEASLKPTGAVVFKRLQGDLLTPNTYTDLQGQSLPVYYPYRPKVTKYNKTPPYLGSWGSWPSFLLRSIYPRVCRS